MKKRPLAWRIYRSLLRMFPFDFQREFGSDMEDVFRQEHRNASQRGLQKTSVLWWRTGLGLLRTASAEHIQVLWQDIRYGWRTLRRSPAFTFGAVVALALGIGANLTIFGFASALLLRPLPAPQPDELVRVSMYRWSNVPYDHYLQYRDRNQTVAELAIVQDAGATLQTDGPPEQTLAIVVSGNYFDSLRIPAALGRTLNEGDDRKGAPGVLMLSDGFWRKRFAADPSVVGRSVVIDGSPFTIIGVTPRSFNGTLSPLVPQIWLAWNGPHRDALDRGSLIGRLRPGVSMERAQADFGTIAAGIARDINESFYLTISSARVVHPELLIPAAVFAALLMALAGLILLIACLNIGGLLLARSAARRKEIGVRLALGASRSQLVRQLLTESLLLSLAGGTAGLAFAFWVGTMLVQLPFPTPVPVELAFTVDWRVVIFATGISIVTSVAFGLAPALHAVRGSVVPALKDATSTTVAKKSLLRAAFTVTQLAVSALLLVMAAMLVRNLTSAETTERGFVAENVLTVTTSLVNAGYTKERGIEFYERLIARLEAAPGIVAANEAEIVPLTASTQESSYQSETSRPIRVTTNVVSRGHFQTLKIPLLAGRDFTEHDRARAPLVCIINERLSRQLWPGENPLGKRVRRVGKTPDGFRGAPWMEVIGVAANSKYVTLTENPRPFLYRPIGQEYDAVGQASLLVKTDGDPMAALPAIRAIVNDLDPAVALFGIARLTDATEISLLPMRIASTFATILGFIALLLGATGIYGVVSYLARNRTREIGIRIALGAKPSHVMKVVTAEAMRWTVIGVALGFVAALIVTLSIKDFIHGITPADPLSFGGIALILGATVYAACWIPARRAMQIDPTAALREE